MRAELIDTANGPRTTLGESPRWEGRAWWWVDAWQGVVWRRHPDEAAVAVWAPGERTSLVQPATDGGVVVARGGQLVLVDGGGSGRPWCDLGLGPGWLANDGAADARGRLWIGSVAPGGTRRGGALLRVDGDGTVHEVAGGFTMSNGMAWHPVASVLFHADSSERVIWAHTVDLESGTVIQSRVFVRLPENDGLPDGLATDVDGGVWVAVHGAGEVRRYSPSGRLDIVVAVDAPQCTSLALGGPDGYDMLITTAREGYEAARSLKEPAAGRLFHARSPHQATPISTVTVDPVS
ncbi:SMP-30/gluconolactonase/LRE family protein [Phytoactinopolyspora limicola]|uniref:SMP-30/gluconolactonase/LRE family protein n=1 Tax=Phytoactinopolyspora limicola TaxID=2715536 RepID=UPI00140BF17E|nr:SMP-30/gluconolactonase/LRE family protein [Phytoactinopolyspora limicola]